MRNCLFICLMFCLPVFSKKTADFSVFMNSHFYISPKTYPQQGDTYVSAGARADIEKEYRYWFYDLSAAGQLALDKSDEHYFSLPSANIGYQLKGIGSFLNLNAIQVSLGRYNKSWSWMNDHWLLGLWNPQNLYDYFNPFNLGIVGSAVTLEGQGWSFTNFVGGVYFPHQQTSVIGNNAGRFESASRWARPPRDSVFMFNKDIDSYYWMEKPYLKNVLFQNSYLAYLLIGNLDNKWITVSFADKPLNQVYYRSRSGLSISDSSLKSFIHYQTLRHKLVSLELGAARDGWRAYFGAAAERIDPVNLPAVWLTPAIPNPFFASVSFSKEIKIPSMIVHFLGVSYLTSRIRGINNRTLIGGDLESVMSLERFRMTEGFSFQWTARADFKKSRKIKSELMYWYSVDQKGGWLSWDLSFFFDKNSKAYMEVNILGSKDKSRKGFFSKYANNDRVSLGMQYGF